MLAYLKHAGFKDVDISSYRLNDEKKEVTIFFRYNVAKCCSGIYVDEEVNVSYDIINGVL
jgi:hypothetical protein